MTTNIRAKFLQRLAGYSPWQQRNRSQRARADCGEPPGWPALADLFELVQAKSDEMSAWVATPAACCVARRTAHTGTVMHREYALVNTSEALLRSETDYCARTCLHRLSKGIATQQNPLISGSTDWSRLLTQPTGGRSNTNENKEACRGKRRSVLARSRSGTRTRCSIDCTACAYT